MPRAVGLDTHAPEFLPLIEFFLDIQGFFGSNVHKMNVHAMNIRDPSY
jgi:hypothetical protein